MKERRLGALDGQEQEFYGTVKEEEMVKKRSFYGTVKEKAGAQGKKSCRIPYSGVREGVVVHLSVVHAPYV